MNKNTSIIIILTCALTISSMLLLNRYGFTGKKTDVTSSSFSIPPSESLKKAFDESAHHTAIADIAELSCLPQSRYDCSLEKGCTSVAPATYYFVDYGTENGTYFRCDEKGCDHYPVNVVDSGSYTQFIPSQGQAMLFKVAHENAVNKEGEFIDIATIGTVTLVSFGKCE